MQYIIKIVTNNFQFRCSYYWFLLNFLFVAVEGILHVLLGEGCYIKSSWSTKRKVSLTRNFIHHNGGSLSSYVIRWAFLLGFLDGMWFTGNFLSKSTTESDMLSMKKTTDKTSQQNIRSIHPFSEECCFYPMISAYSPATIRLNLPSG